MTAICKALVLHRKSHMGDYFFTAKLTDGHRTAWVRHFERKFEKKTVRLKIETAVGRLGKTGDR
jgi:hypothetical protein